jgi:hypothetical protein
MKTTYSDDTIDALLVKALAVHFDDLGAQHAMELIETLPDPEPEILVELPETYSELKRLANEKRVRRSMLIAPIFAMNRDQSAETYDDTTEEELRRAREEARARIIRNKAAPESK